MRISRGDEMMCYRDITFCPFWKECWSGPLCTRALTDGVKKKAEMWWGKPNPPISTYVDKPTCFEQVKK